MPMSPSAPAASMAKQQVPMADGEPRATAPRAYGPRPVRREASSRGTRRRSRSGGLEDTRRSSQGATRKSNHPPPPGVGGGDSSYTARPSSSGHDGRPTCPYESHGDTCPPETYHDPGHQGRYAHNVPWSYTSRGGGSNRHPPQAPGTARHPDLLYSDAESSYTSPNSQSYTEYGTGTGTRGYTNGSYGYDSDGYDGDRAPPPRCPQDHHCLLINDPDHQERYRHTCRRQGCSYTWMREHRRLFAHPDLGDDSPTATSRTSTPGTPPVVPYQRQFDSNDLTPGNISPPRPNSIPPTVKLPGHPHSNDHLPPHLSRQSKTLPDRGRRSPAAPAVDPPHGYGVEGALSTHQQRGPLRPPPCDIKDEGVFASRRGSAPQQPLQQPPTRYAPPAPGGHYPSRSPSLERDRSVSPLRGSPKTPPFQPLTSHGRASFRGNSRRVAAPLMLGTTKHQSTGSVGAFRNPPQESQRAARLRGELRESSRERHRETAGDRRTMVLRELQHGSSGALTQLDTQLKERLKGFALLKELENLSAELRTLRHLHNFRHSLAREHGAGSVAYQIDHSARRVETAVRRAEQLRQQVDPDDLLHDRCDDELAFARETLTLVDSGADSTAPQTPRSGAPGARAHDGDAPPRLVGATVGAPGGPPQPLNTP